MPRPSAVLARSRVHDMTRFWLVFVVALGLSGCMRSTTSLEKTSNLVPHYSVGVVGGSVVYCDVYFTLASDPNQATYALSTDDLITCNGQTMTMTSPGFYTRSFGYTAAQNYTITVVRVVDSMKL